MHGNKTLIPVLLVVSLVAGSSFAQGHAGGCSCGNLFPVPSTWEIDHPAGSEWVSAASAEFARWNTVATVFNPVQGDVSAGINSKNEIFFADPASAFAVYGVSMSSTTYGFSAHQPKTSFGSPAFNACPKPAGTYCGSFNEVDVIINLGFATGWTTAAPPDFDSAGPAYYGATALHEVGHALGLHHNFNNLSTMNYFEDFAAQYLSLADAQALRANYPSSVHALADIGTYPFHYYSAASDGYTATTPVVVSPTTVSAGNNITINYLTVENVGTSSLNDVTLELYLSTDAIITGTDRKILTGHFNSSGPFPASSYWECPSPTCAGLPVQIPGDTPGGSYFVGGRVLYNGSVADTVSYNNTWIAPQKLTVSGGGNTSPCVRNSTTACLSGGRIEVKVDYNSATGGSGAADLLYFGGQRAETAESSFWWFFYDTNFEMGVKVIDACSYTGNFWIYVSGLTESGYTVRLRNTQTGETKTYSNPNGTYPQTIGDTGVGLRCN